MTKRSCGENRNPFRNRFISCVALGLYTFALIILPSWHRHCYEHLTDTCCEHSEPTSCPPDSDDSCPVCEFAVLAVPFLTASEPLLWQTDVIHEISFSLSIPPVADVTDLPPCRAPPVADAINRFW